MKKADALRVEGTIRGERQRLGWEGYVNINLVGLGWSGERERKIERVENDDGYCKKTEPGYRIGTNAFRP